MGTQINVRELHPPEVACHFADLQVNTNLVKQHSDLWFTLRSEAQVTGSTLYNALGLHTQRAMENHFNEHVHKVPGPQSTEEAKKRMEYGSENEANAIATLSGIFMPALLPHCSTIYEEGCYFLSSTQIEKMMEVSPDGFIATCNNQECYNPYELPHESLVVKVKCPFPNEDLLPIHYEVPQYYMLQLLAEMKAKNVTTALYVSYSKQSTAFIKISFSWDIWI